MKFARTHARTRSLLGVLILASGVGVLGRGLAGCATRASDAHTRSAAPIINGWDDDDTPPRNATVLIRNSAGTMFCSGSLVTSVHVLTAGHCNIQAGDEVLFGADNTNAGGIARARRNVVAGGVGANLPGLGSGNLPLWQRARDVAIVRFAPPITMQASPRKPSFARPPLTPAVSGWESGALNGGISGYGLVPTWTTPPDGGPVLFNWYSPSKRQAFTSGNLGVFHVDTGGGYAVWVRTYQTNLSSGEAHGYLGDSGGPLFRQLSANHDARDVLGVSSGFNWSSCAILPQFICADDHASDIYADITAPAMRAWIEQTLDPNGDGRWSGEVDYVRPSFGTPGCDVQSTPGCDPGCDAAKDRDCDLISDQNDNCKDDYNPDQLNSDDPVSPGDPASHDPGDACDLCPTIADNGVDNCNSDAEILKWGPRPRLREDAVVGPDPLNPAALPVVDQVKARYQGDACDFAPCTELGARARELDPAKYGTPDPTQAACLMTAEFGGHCAFKAAATVEHDGRWLKGLAAMNGSTGYRFCQCDGPFKTQAQRIANCFEDQTGPQCPREALLFTTSAKLDEIHADPAFAAIPGSSPPETGTADVFTGEKKASPPSLGWLFEQDVNAIMGTPNPVLPLTHASAAAIAIDGLLWSHVRQTSSVLPAQLKDLQSQWLPLRLRVQADVFGASFTKALPLPGWWHEDCPQCDFGLKTGWTLVTEPSLTPAMFGLTSNGALDITASVNPVVLDLLRSVAGSPERQVVTAAEHRSTLERLAPAFAPGWVVVDPVPLTYVGAVGQDVAGNFVPVRGRVVDASAPPFMAAASKLVAVKASQGSAGGVARATLSALRQELYVMRRDSEGTKLHRFDLLEEQWSLVSLRGPTLPGLPLALTYDAQARALFVLDRSNGSTGAMRLLRIRLDGRVELMAQGFGIGQDAQVFLTASELGHLVVSATREHPARFGVLELDAFGAVAKPTRRLKGKGKLRAPPFVTERALHLLLERGDGTLEAAELQLGALAPAGNDWVQVFR